MEEFKFIFMDKNYELKEDNCDYFINDEEQPVEGIEASDILSLLNQAEAVDFQVDYYDLPCENCSKHIDKREKYFKFLEYHFYIFTKNSDYVISTLSKEYESTSYNALLKQGKVDNSYIVSIAVCIECGSYSIEIEQCEI